MDFGWTDEQLALYDSTVELGQRLDAGADSERFDIEIWRQIGDSGLLGAMLPAEYGGADRDIITTVLMLEGLGYGCRNNGLTLAVNGTIWAVMEPILRFGSDSQKQRYLPGLSTGELIGCHAMTEPDAGSDSFSMRTKAEPKDRSFLLNGRKVFIGMAPESDVAVVFAKTEPELGSWGISVFLVDLATDGIKVTGPTEKMGLKGNPLGEIAFENCLVPESAMLGPAGAGMSIFNDSMEWERSFIFASHVGSMARQLDETIAYATRRSQFGQPIGKNQSVSNRIVDMKLRLETAQLLLYRAAWMKERDRPAGMESALTKLAISESFVASSLDAVRVHGGVGYLSETGVERDLRDSVGGVIYSGTSDIQRQVVARILGL